MAREHGNFEAVRDLVPRLLAGLGLESRMREYHAIEVWESVVGEAIALQAHPNGIRDGVLFVTVANSVWVQELMLLREQIVARLNERLGVQLVRKIVLSIDRPPLHGGFDANSTLQRSEPKNEARLHSTLRQEIRPARRLRNEAASSPRGEGEEDE